MILLQKYDTCEVYRDPKKKTYCVLYYTGKKSLLNFLDSECYADGLESRGYKHDCELPKKYKEKKK